jgi:hypothetical protein
LTTKPRNAQLLGISAQGWASFQTISEWHDDYSHASFFSLATQAMFAAPGHVILGGEFDDGKRAAYRKELGLRVSAMARLCEVTSAVERHVKAAQAVELYKPRPPAG